ncbi:MAG: prepilin-type N-terminal cleavage/methylation domain-containing protein, partial [Dehalococcoidia bacterium]
MRNVVRMDDRGITLIELVMAIVVLGISV